MMNLKDISIPYITSAVIRVETMTITALALSSFSVGQETLETSSLVVSFIYALIFPILFLIICTGGEARTPSPQFWRLMLYQLSYARMLSWQPPAANFYFITSTTCPAPTVLPPSRIAKRRPLSIATG